MHLYWAPRFDWCQLQGNHQTLFGRDPLHGDTHTNRRFESVILRRGSCFLVGSGRVLSEECFGASGLRVCAQVLQNCQLLARWARSWARFVLQICLGNSFASKLICWPASGVPLPLHRPMCCYWSCILASGGAIVAHQVLFLLAACKGLLVVGTFHSHELQLVQDPFQVP